ncbi:hypothetical protein KXD40_008084 [Peronospora effusa]|uniref:DUF8003 domain-containing protein n=1 Tax=Peronospora effusa TaxID=542832 RepID=A0A3M6VUY7_9STRA|nr:hypothetical protein DD238_006795 [Peronospora effusa]RQM16470.1 hypothetical protein DD237_004662 [Peronospora effusa]UIZ23996.1 hypothetical protein KXD40_008084 [Peronospora effusa]
MASGVSLGSVALCLSLFFLSILVQALKQPHCADFLQHCAWNASTSSCEFRKSISFVCGPRNVLIYRGFTANTTLSFPDENHEPKAAAIAGFTCHWDVAGALQVAPNVTVAVNGDDCLLHIGSGQMVLIGAKAMLRASSLSIEASFVHLEVEAQIAASYSGTFRGNHGFFTGTDVFGASYGGGGGQRLIANATILTQQTTRGFFDVRGRTLEMQLMNEKEALLMKSSAGWEFADLWAMEKELMANPAVSGVERDPSAMIAPFLLGSGSRVVIDGAGRAVTVNGGGRIQIKASKDVVVMDGAIIQANGASAVEGVSGGSGGSVYISANALSLSGDIQAKGGDAFCTKDASERGITHCFPAGGGGRVQITYMSSQLDTKAIDATGGTLSLDQTKKLLTKKKRFRHVQISALAGAAGTYYQVVQHSDGVQEAQLIVNNDMQHLRPNHIQSKDGKEAIDINDMDTVIGGAVTSLYVGGDKASKIDALTISNGAVVATGCLKLPGGDLKVLNGSFLLDALLVEFPLELPDSISNHTPLLQIRVRDMIVSSGSQMSMPTSALQLSARSFLMDATAALEFTWSAQIITSQNIHIDANVSSAFNPIIAAPATTMNSFTSLTTTKLYDSKILSLVSGGDVALGGMIAVGALSVSSEVSISINGHLEAFNIPSIKSNFRSCKEQQWQSLRFMNEEDLETKVAHDGSEMEPTIPAVPSYLPTASNFTLELHARGSIYVGESEKKKQQLEIEIQDDDGLPPQPVGTLRGGAVLLCATDSVEISQGSIISADGAGQLANQGPGMGSCTGSIGGGAGYGGRGADSSLVTKIGSYASGGLPYGTRSGAGMLGSGGGCVNGGNGGGIIIVGASGLVLNGEIQCNGDGGANGAGGGSGGFLGLSVAQYLRGHGHISAVGGGSECTDTVTTVSSDAMWHDPTPLIGNIQDEAADKQEAAQSPMSSTVAPRLCGGGGGGGRLQLTGCELSPFSRCTKEFDGNYTVAGGATSYKLASIDGDTPALPAPIPARILPAGASGSFFGFPCPPGSGGLFCRLCAVGKYKSESNSAECVVCTNAPANAHYIGSGATSARCDWACDPGYSGYYCVSPIQQLLDACGGEFGFALVLMSIVTFFILLGYACRNRKEPSYTRMYNSRGTKGERQHLLSSAVANSQRSWYALLFRCFYWPRVGYPKLMERDLPEHMARLYFAGYNDPASPLKLRTTVPPSLKKVLYDVEFRNLADRINRVLAWQRGPCSSWGKIVHFLVALLCYPFASEVKLFRRHIRVNELKRIVAKYNHACMKGPRARGLLNAVKLGYCADYSLVYLELLYKESSQSVCVPTTKVGKPSLPLVLLFAGCGTYFSPFYLDPNDLLVRSIPQCPELTAFIDEPWIEFVAELNELLRVLQRDAVSLVESLLPVAVYLEKQRALSVLGSNSSKLGGLRIYLGRFYVQDELSMGEEFKLGLFLSTAKESLDNVGSNNTANLQQPPSSSSRQGYGSHYTKDSNYYNINDVYGYGRGDSMDYPSHRHKCSIGNDGMLYDMGGWGTASNNNGASRGRIRSSTGSVSGNAATQNPVSSIREEALRIRSSSSYGDGLAGNGHSGRGENSDDVMVLMGSGSAKKKSINNATHQSSYEGWLGPVDASLPVPGVLICADELRERLADRALRQRLMAFLRFYLMPRNLPRSSSLNLSWMLSISLLTLLMVDLAITFAILVNLKCVTEGEVDHDCSASIMVPVLLMPPLALIVSPIVGIISLALSSSTFTRRFSVWNALSMISVGIAILACVAQSSRLVAPWFAGPLPLLPVIAMGVKAGQAYLVERYIAFQETQRRRRGWRGIMKRRLSDASIPTESP